MKMKPACRACNITITGQPTFRRNVRTGKDFPLCPTCASKSPKKRFDVVRCKPVSNIRIDYFERELRELFEKWGICIFENGTTGFHIADYHPRMEESFSALPVQISNNNLVAGFTEEFHVAGK